MLRLTLKEWCESRKIPIDRGLHVSYQLKVQYPGIQRVLNGEQIDAEYLEQELVQLVFDTKNGRFPVKRFPKKISDSSR